MTNTFDQFAVFHISIQSKNKELASEYSISYTSGIREISLEDGFIIDFVFIPYIENTFYYSAEKEGHAFLTIGMEDVDEPAKFEMKLFFCNKKI